MIEIHGFIEIEIEIGTEIAIGISIEIDFIESMGFVGNRFTECLVYTMSYNSLVLMGSEWWVGAIGA